MPLANSTKDYPVLYHDSWNTLDSSKVHDYQLCFRKYFFSHILGWKPEYKSHDLIFGEAFHLMLGHLYQTKFQDLDGSYQAFLDRYRMDFYEDTDEQHSPKNPARVLAAMQKYIEAYAREDLKLTVKKIEMFGTAPISQDFDIAFRIDMIAQTPEGIISPYEHKTTKWNITNWADQFKMRFQIGTYTYVVNCLYGDLESVIPVIVNGVVFQKTDIKLNRFPVRKTLADIELWLASANDICRHIEHDIDILSKTGLQSKTMNCFLPNGNGCLAYNRSCEYMDWCVNYPNPLKVCQTIQPGFKREFWEPLKDKEVEIVKPR